MTSYGTIKNKGQQEHDNTANSKRWAGNPRFRNAMRRDKEYINQNAYKRQNQK